MSDGNEPLPKSIEECKKLPTLSEKAKCLRKIIDGTRDEPETLPKSEIGVNPPNTIFPKMTKEDYEEYVASLEPKQNRKIVSEEPVNLETPTYGVPNKTAINDLQHIQIEVDAQKLDALREEERIKIRNQNARKEAQKRGEEARKKGGVSKKTKCRKSKKRKTKRRRRR
jgi:hypothetical protein